ncbi:related to PCL6 - cyclin like protein interacting with Pho85p [Melanopsichium pennsylvanicum]|uniref:Related to PCL6 - cyclin like protein interacting with Pho85p n=2 Tax=Melanopsichium pennsylvanicum TaxID=63383 RepID=A0AAJ4XKH5_9BASI|nr:related to PCL6-cyclin like protein interacting with Pho85p [Melanopsichium pennsylvanicum 4]SNX84444.1 related to PCL6 - cyclin like protein interacting with Pho85p [Melanopsichium pennsylvanicum]
MHSTSPDPSCADSPPGPPSSQSSSVGSCYTSSSSQASLRARPTLSHPSSSATSPASAYDRTPEHSYGPTLSKRPAQSAAYCAHPTSSVAPTLADNRSHDPFTSLRAQAAAASHLPRNHHTRSSTMEQPGNTSYETIDSRGYDRAGPSNGILSDYSTHPSRQAQSFGSPDNNRGPAPKARRTSPGGSRASGNLHPSHEPSQYSSYGASLHSFSHASRSPIHSGTTSSESLSTSALHSQGGFADAGSHHHWHQLGQSQQPSARASQSSTSAMLSPRTRVDDGQGLVTASEVQRSHPASSKASLTDGSEGVNRSKPQSSLPKMDLATFAPQELLKILATLLHEIATANDEFQPDGSKDDSRSKRGGRSRDRSAPTTPAESGDGPDALRDYSAPPGSHLSFTDARRPSVTTAALGALATPSSTLCFHARNVPSISIESYLLRILKYCPTTNEVFLSLLVYFDRMSRMGSGAKPGANGDGEVAGEAAGLPRAVEWAKRQSEHSDTTTRPPDASASAKEEPGYTHPGIRGFAIDSYNVHRLVIAGVTVASKFFSDVFYTNSRYAKVGGLPPQELNQLELQFLLLNDFRLTIPLEEMQRYADQLLMYARGRPDMAQMTREMAPACPSGGERAGASSSTTGATAANNDLTTGAVKAAYAAESTASRVAADPAHGAVSGRSDADAEGDVQMSDARR